ncbi:phosphate acetyl/butaryl transferase family protein [Methyloversatilis sp. RAC08]|uniref:bifunctional enoyl-CoA hydratase/phosphate acetyltransferase n=1 Tax=Methyloversatilis sp. RAC08 TaxID=1842540 RepID=UPI00083D9AEB|nr:bifunctional enoyl-CoA hydratase/phosphate acetyltransferase [Methyloversatilis sp. RAC08]AOF82346.1 phosphate acetyl/butaryl transferase family protein [Methyloversatilis sp. RAC08]
MNHFTDPDSLWIENRTYDEIAVGDTATLLRTLRHEDIHMFAIMSGDINPAHVDAEYARSSIFTEVIAHGMWGGALISTLLGTQFPGPGTIYVDQTLHFSRPVRVGDTVTVTVRCDRKFDHNKHMILDCVCINQHGEKVIHGTAEVLAPSDKVRLVKTELPEFRLSDTRKTRFERLMQITHGLTPISMAVAHPCDAESLRGALLARDRGLIVPTLVGPEAKIRRLAEEFGMDLGDCRIVDTPHSHASAERAVALCRAGECEALMKGSLHTDELVSEVIRKDTGLRTARRMSHVFVMDVPTYPRLMLITDAAINVAPTLLEKADIVQNAIDLAHILHIPEPKVALLAAVETVNPAMPSTIDAAALCKMADRGQIRGGLLDGPLAFDNAISAAAALTKGIRSVVAGQADILVVPDIESGNMLAKQMEYLAEALAAGIVLGARVPFVLTSRADSAETRTTSTAIAVVMAHAKRNAVTRGDA